MGCNVKLVNCLVSFNDNGTEFHGNFTIQNCNFVRNAIEKYALEIFGDVIVENSIFAFNSNNSTAIFTNGNFTSKNSIYYNKTDLKLSLQNRRNSFLRTT